MKVYILQEEYCCEKMGFQIYATRQAAEAAKQRRYDGEMDGCDYCIIERDLHE